MFIFSISKLYHLSLDGSSSPFFTFSKETLTSHSQETLSYSNILHELEILNVLNEFKLLYTLFLVQDLAKQCVEPYKSKSWLIAINYGN